MRNAGDERLAGDGRLSEENRRFRSGRQVDVEPGAEPDQPEDLAGGKPLAERQGGIDPPSHQAGDLNDPDADRIGPLEANLLPFVLVAVFVGGADEFAMVVRQGPNHSGTGGAVDVDAEDTHKDADADPLFFPQIEGLGGDHLHDRADQPVGRREDPVGIVGGHPVGIAEEVEGEHEQGQADSPECEAAPGVGEEAQGAEEPEGPKKSSGRRFGKKEKAKAARPAYEYVDKSQNSEIQELLTKATRSALSKLIIAFLLCIVVFYLELASPDSGAYSVYTRPGRFGILYLLVDFQVLCFMAITLLDSIKKGCVGLFTGKPCGESVFFALFAAAAAHTIVTAFMHPRADLGVFCLPCAVCGVCLAFVKYLECRKDYHCFKVVASTRAKYVAQQLKGDTKEAIEFYKYLFDDSEIYTTRKAAFVEGFFRRLHTRPESESLSGFAILLSFIAALGLGIYKAATGEPAYESVTQAIQTLCFALPVSSLFIISLPVIKANLIGKRNGSAFIGNAVGEEYADASVISFSDNEVYPSNLVKITSVKIYGDNRIDRILYDIAEVFAFAGGPLRTVTGNMITGGVPAPESARLIESASDGICVVINGNEMFLGKRDYMRRYRYDAPYDNSDAAFERKNGSVMFVVKGGQLIAKVYIKYHINPQFNSLLRDLYKAGMCVGIKTTDPNIIGDLIEKSVKFKKTPISILKAGDVSDVEAECERVDSGIVANASLHTFLKMFIVCDKVRHVTKANGIINMLSLAVAFFLRGTPPCSS